MNILIVEDDAISRKVMMNKLHGIGECTPVNSGKEAIAHFQRSIENNTPYDVIILDVSMPNMDGVETLRRIRKEESKQGVDKSEQIKIIMVTAQIRKAIIKECIRLGCNSYITKPFKTVKIFEELERFGFSIPDAVKHKDEGRSAYTDMVSKIIKRFNDGEIDLPVLPHIVREVQTALKDKETGIEDLAAIVEKDAVLSAQIIHVANSALFRGVDKAVTLSDAMVRLGLKTCLSVITTITSKNLFDSDNEKLKVLLDKIWLHSLACASCCKLISEELDAGHVDNIFLMGIVHDIGKVILLKAFADISPDTPFEADELLAAVQDVHTVFGAVLVKKWGFSDLHIRGAELHHWTTYPEDIEKEMLILHIANIMVSRIGFASFFDPDPTRKDMAFSDDFLSIIKVLKIDEETVKKLNGAVADVMVELSDQF